MSSDSPTPQFSFQSLSDAPQTAAVASSSSTTAAPPPPQSRQAAEDARKDRTLAEFLLMLDEYEPLVCIPSPAALQLTRVADSQRGHRLLSPESRIRMRRRSPVSRFLVHSMYIHLYPLCPANAFFLSPPKNSSQTLPLMHTNMLVYAQTQRVGGLAQPFQVQVPRYAIAKPYSKHQVPDISKDKTRTTLTMDDLGAALAEYGINARKPEFYI